LSWVSSLSTGRLPKYKQMKMTIKNCTELNLIKRKKQSKNHNMWQFSLIRTSNNDDFES
jgi:hypothetical protein